MSRTSRLSVARLSVARLVALTLATLFSMRAAASTAEPTRVSLPSGPGSIEGLGRNFTPSLASGTASYSVEIAVPPSAGGFAPHLSLDYDSGGGVSELGMGFRLSGVSRVRLRTEDGLPRFVDADPVEVVGLGVPSDLLEIAPGLFRPEYESGAFVRVERAGDGWEARDKAGTTYRFGGDAFVEREGSRVATWLLRESLDLHGHRIAYEWDASTGHALLVRVAWSDFGAGPRDIVSFRYEPRPDAHVSFAAGIRQIVDRRMAAIDVTHAGALVRRYEIGYAPGPHARVASIALLGRDGTSRRPPLSFAYTEASFAADGQIATMTSPPGRTPADASVDLADLDGDALPDLLVTRAGAYRSYSNDDGRRWSGGVDWPIAGSPSLDLASSGVVLADVDGDGAVDLVAKSGSAAFRYFPAGSATSFRPPVAIGTVPSFALDDPDVRLADMDGDRRVDVVITTAAGLSIGYNVRGVDWSEPVLTGVVDPGQPLRFSDGGLTQLCDVNGDRVQDLCVLRSADLVYWLGRGRGAFEPPAKATGVPAWDPSSPWELRDLDGDGWTDLVHVGVDQVDYALATAMARFEAPRAIRGVPTRAATTAVRFADMNGSGTTDIVWIDPSIDPSLGWRYLELFPGGRGGLLARIDNGLGKIVTIRYRPAASDAAAARAAGSPWTSRINIGMPVVARVEVDASLGDPTMATEYTYRDGAWSAAERTFAGFRGGVERDLGDAYTPTLVTESAFDVGMDDRTQRGLLLSTETRTEGGSVFARSRTTFTTRALERAGEHHVHYTFKSAEETTAIDVGTSAGRTTLVEWDEDEYGDVVAERKWGEIAGDDRLVGGDEAVTLRSFASNSRDWALGRVASEEVQDGRGARVRLRRTYYDGAPFGGLPLGQVARGDATRVEEWVGPGEGAFELVTGTSFDADGNPVELRDARGGGRTFQWDPVDHTSLSSESVKLEGRTMTARVQYDGAFGTVVLTSAYDGQTTELAYDAFGRLTAIARPGDTLDQPTTRYTYDERAPLSRVVVERRTSTNAPDVEHEEQLTDGLGRKRGTLTADDGGRWVLANVDRLDARGTPRRSLLPRFVPAEARGAPPIAVDAPGSDAWRDATGRVTRTRSQLGRETRTEYAPFTTKRWDGAQADGASPFEHTPVVEIVDGLGRLVAKELVLAGRSLRSTYAYTADGLLAARVDPEGHAAHYTYDGRGRRVVVDDPDAGRHLFGYDATGNLVEHRKPDGVVVRATFDLAGRPLTEDWDGDGKPEVVRTWDFGGGEHAYGRLVSAAAQGIRVDHGYDERGRETSTRYAIDESHYDVRRAFDDQDREILHGYPDGSSIRIRRGARGTVTGYGDSILVDADADGAELRRSYGTGVVARFAYDDDRRLRESAAEDAAGHAIQHLRWTYDDADNIAAVDDLRPGIDPAHDRGEAYERDNLYRLTSARGAWGQVAYRYSACGALAGRDSADLSLAAGPIEIGRGAGPHALTRFGDRAVRYDANGRAVDDGARALTWDAADRVRSVSAHDAQTTSRYDADGARRVRVERGADGTEQTTHFLDAWSEVRDGALRRYVVHAGARIVELAPGNGPKTADSSGCRAARGEAEGRGAITVVLLAMAAGAWRARRREPARMGRGAAALIALACSLVACSGGADQTRDLGGTVRGIGEADRIVFYDGGGTVTAVTTGIGAMIGAFRARPHGTASGDDVDQSEVWSQGVRDRTVSLDTLGARVYSPELQSWLSPDPVVVHEPEFFVGPARRDATGIVSSAAGLAPRPIPPRSRFDAGAYAYAYDDPVGNTDPTGLFGVGMTFGAVAEFGNRLWGIGGNVSAAAGVFHARGGGTSVGGALSGGAMIGSPPVAITAPNVRGTELDEPSGIMGLAVGAGLGFFGTNADRAEQLGGPFMTTSVTTPWISVQYSVGKDDAGKTIRVVSVSPGAKSSFSTSRYPTNSVAKTLLGDSSAATRTRP